MRERLESPKMNMGLVGLRFHSWILLVDHSWYVGA